MSARLRIGTASWSDPGFVQDWYPPGLPRTQLLGWYAQQFDFVEVNSTFYSIPDERVTDGWARQTPPDFLFDLKLFKLLSRHSTETRLLPPDLRAKAGGREKAALNPEIEGLVLERFLRQAEPLRAAGKLGAFLLQLSPSFQPGSNDLGELENLIRGLGRERLAVELRHREWLVGPQRERTIEFFTRHGVSLVMVDAPASEHMTVMPFVDTVTQPGLAYWRFHGRNEAAFVRGRTVADRFDYDYSAEELEEIAKKAEALSGIVRELHLVFNNNRSNFAPKAAARLLEMVLAKKLEAGVRPSPIGREPGPPRQGRLPL